MKSEDSNPKVKPRDYFKRVHLSERKILFLKVAANKFNLFIKGEFEELVPVIAFRNDKNVNLFCAPGLESLRSCAGQTVVVNFSDEEERYFFTTTINFEGEIPFLKIDVDLFQLQRRLNMRFDIPDRYKAFVNIVEYNGKAISIEARILNISAGGCRIVIDDCVTFFKMEDKITIFLHLGQRRPLKFQVDIRFVLVKELTQTLGLQFLYRDSILENKMLTMMTDLQLELYLKYTTEN